MGGTCIGNVRGHSPVRTVVPQVRVLCPLATMDGGPLQMYLFPMCTMSRFLLRMSLVQDRELVSSNMYVTRPFEQM